jgi:DNA-binding CsgD family transcriptional regulator
MLVLGGGRHDGELLDALCGCATFDELGADVLPRLADETRASSGSFRQVLAAGDAARLGHSAAHGVDPRDHERWKSAFPVLDPVGIVAGGPPGTCEAFSVAESEYGAALREPLLRAFYEPVGVHHALIARIELPGWQRITFGLHRTRAEGAFRRTDVERMAAALRPLHATVLRLWRTDPERRASALASLTIREGEIARDVAQGLSNKEIAGRRSISIRTVENHLAAIFAKLSVERRTQLAVLVALPESPRA